MLEVAADAAGNGYGPEIVGALISGGLTGVFAGLVAKYSADRAVNLAEKERVQERTDRDTEAVAERRDALNRQVVSEFAAAAKDLHAAHLRMDPQAVHEAFYWADSRADHVAVLLMGQRGDDLAETFGRRWKQVSLLYWTATTLNKASGEWEFQIPADVDQEAMVDNVRELEFLTIRWANQPISEWSFENPRPDVLSSQRTGPEGSQDVRQ